MAGQRAAPQLRLAPRGARLQAGFIEDLALSRWLVSFGILLDSALARLGFPESRKGCLPRLGSTRGHGAAWMQPEHPPQRPPQRWPWLGRCLSVEYSWLTMTCWSSNASRRRALHRFAMALGHTTLGACRRGKCCFGNDLIVLTLTDAVKGFYSRVCSIQSVKWFYFELIAGRSVDWC